MHLAKYTQKLEPQFRVCEHTHTHTHTQNPNFVTPLTSNLQKCLVLFCFNDYNRIAWTGTDNQRKTIQDCLDFTCYSTLVGPRDKKCNSRLFFSLPPSQVPRDGLLELMGWGRGSWRKLFSAAGGQEWVIIGTVWHYCMEVVPLDPLSFLRQGLLQL